MKNEIYDFIQSYISFCEEKSTKLSEIILIKPELHSFLKNIKLNNKVAYSNILKLDESNSMYLYFKMLLAYYEKKQTLLYSTSQMAKVVNLPELTLKRFENLNTLINLHTLCQIFSSLNLNITIES